MKRLQQLSLDHNELISTAGLSHTFTLLHLSCSHNHLTRAEGLENNALLHTLDLSANSLAEVKQGVNPASVIKAISGSYSWFILMHSKIYLKIRHRIR